MPTARPSKTAEVEVFPRTRRSASARAKDEETGTLLLSRRLKSMVAIDLLGFGRSEGQDRLMFPQAMGDFIVVPTMRSASSNRMLLDPTSARRTRCSLR